MLLVFLAGLGTLSADESRRGALDRGVILVPAAVDDGAFDASDEEADNASEDESGDEPQGPVLQSFPFIPELYQCIIDNDYDSFIEALHNGADVHQRTISGQTLFHIAAIHNRTDFIVDLVRAGASIDAQDSFGKTPLFWAALRGNILMIKLLVHYQADPRKPDRNNVTPYDVANYPCRLAMYEETTWSEALSYYFSCCYCCTQSLF